MTIDERVEKLMIGLPVLAQPKGDVNGNRNYLRNALMEVARDQRHACAEAVAGVADDAADEIQVVRNTLESSRYESLTKAERKLRNLSNAVMNAQID